MIIHQNGSLVLSTALLVSLLTGLAWSEPGYLPYAEKIKDKDIPVSSQPVLRHELNDATEQQGLGLLQQDNTACGALNDGQTFFVLDHIEGVELPHCDWAKPYAGGPVKVLALAQTPIAYDLVQIEQRLDGKLFIALIDQSTAAGNPGGNFGHMNLGHAELYEKLILKRLKDLNPDVILVDEMVKPVLRRPAVAEELSRRVKDGMGIVAILGRKFDASIPNVEGELIPGLIPFDSKRELPGFVYNKPWMPVGEAHSTWSGVAWRALPTMYHLYKTPSLPGWETRVTMGETPILLTSEQGKGRLVAFVSKAGLGELIFPDVGMFGKGTSVQKARVMDDLAGFYIKMLLWAAQRDTGLLFNVECPETVEPLKELPVRVAVFKNSKEVKCALDVTVQNERRESIYSIQKQVTLTPGGESLFTIPALKCKGKYYIDVVARDTAGKSLWWAGNAVEVNQGLALDIRIDKDILKPGEPLTGKVVCQGDLAPYLPLTRVIELWDSFGRLLYQDKKAVDQTADTSFSFDLAYCPARMLAVVARLESGDRTSAYAEKEATIPVFGMGDDFHTTMWLSHSFDMNTHLNILRRYGFDSILGSPDFYSGRYSHAAAWNNMSLAIENGGVDAVRLGGCGSYGGENPDIWPGNVNYEKGVQAYVDKAKQLKRYGCQMISMANENQPWHLVQAKGATEDFRKYLQAEYSGDLSKLNAEWDTAFPSWESVVPSSSKPEKLNFAPELEQQQFIRKTAAREQKRIADIYFNEWGQSVPWGTSSSGYSIYQAELGSSMYTYNWSGEIGYDIWNQGSEISFLNGYEHPESRYVMSPWESLFRGSKGESHYLSAGVSVIYGAFNRRGMWLKKHSAEIRDGIGKLLATSTLQHDPVAILYEENTSFTDYREWGVMSLFAGKNPMDIQSYCRFAIAGRKSMWALLRDAQVRPMAMTEKQIQAGQLKGIKMLVLSTAGCLSEATAKSIGEWVNKEGGLLVADLLPGAFDERGKWRGKSPLDPLFGIERTELKLIHYPPEYTAGILKSAPGFLPDLGVEWFYVQFHEGGIKVTDGEALGKHYVKGESPAFIYKKNGSGAALYLNYIDTEYFRTKDPRHLRFMQALLRQAGVQPPVRLLDPVDKDTRPGYQITRFIDDQAMHIGVIGGDGEDTVIELNEEAYIYDVRKHELLGKGKEARTVFTKSYPRLISCLPCRIDGVKIEMPQSVKRGDMVKFNVDATLEGKPTSLVYRLEFLNPDGEPVEAYFSKVRAPAGRYAGTIQFALNDKPGNWTVKATEIVSGKSMAYAFKIK